MSELIELLAKGGPVMIPIVGLSVFLYERCFSLLVFLVRARRAIERDIRPERAQLAAVRHMQADLPEVFAQQRIVIRAMVAAAPLLGLLGTVTGMIQTFDSIADRAGEHSMAGLADGISQALITTETGLAVVIPAVLVLYYAHRQMQKGVQRLTQLENLIEEGAA